MTQIKLRRDTAANFTSKNPILGQGEPAYETDTKKMKIGDGTTAYNDLTYFDAGGGSTPSNMVTTDTKQFITGKKEFTQSINIYNSNLVRGVQSENYKNGAGLSMEDNTSSALRPFSPLWVGYNTDGDITSSSHIYTQDTIQLLKNKKNEPVVLDDDGKLPALDGSKLTNISSSPSTTFPFAQTLTDGMLNLNNITDNGLWYYDGWSNSNPTNTPQDVNDLFFLEVLRYKDDSSPFGSLNRTLQRLTYIYNSGINKCYIRSGVVQGYTQWTPWVELGGSGGSSNKSRIIDTDAVVSPTWGTAFTCPADGICVFGCWMDANAGEAIYPLSQDDSTNYITRYAYAGSGRFYAYNSITVNKGQPVIATSGGSTGEYYFKFYPYKEIEVS